MKALNKLRMIVIASSVLAGCGDSDSKAENATATESQTPTAQVQQVEKKVEKAAPALSEKHEAVLKAIPQPEPKLEEPIAISDQKSATGAKDLKKLNDFFDKERSGELKKVSNKLQSFARQRISVDDEAKKAEFFAAVKQAKELFDKYEQDIAALNIQDPEVKSLIEQHIINTKLVNSLMIVIGENSEFLNNLGKDKADNAFVKEYNERNLALQKNFRAAQKVFLDAYNKLNQKYSQ